MAEIATTYRNAAISTIKSAELAMRQLRSSYVMNSRRPLFGYARKRHDAQLVLRNDELTLWQNVVDRAEVLRDTPAQRNFNEFSEALTDLRSWQVRNLRDA